MERVFDGKFHYNEESYSWERADKEQCYKGVKIISITYHRDSLFGKNENHRFYELTWWDGRVGQLPINKRCTFKDVKDLIDTHYDRTNR